MIPGTSVASLVCPRHGAYLLDPSQLEQAANTQQEVRRANVDGKPVRYLTAGRGDRVILYLHGTGTGFEATFFNEVCLVEAGFRVIMPNRPGYPGTPLSGRESPADCADMALGVLEEEGIDGKVAVVGRSGGGPCALSFATRYQHKTSALVLQAAVTHHWSDPSFVPTKLRHGYNAAPEGSLNLIRCLRYGFCDAVALAGRRVRRNVSAFKRRFVGERRLGIANADPAVDIYFRHEVSRMKSMAAKARGEDIIVVDGHRLLPGDKNDVNIFLGDPCCFWTPSSFFAERRLTVPTLILHDRTDPIVPAAHAEYIRKVLDQNGVQEDDAELVWLHVAGHIHHLGTDARLMHQTRVRFFNRCMQQSLK